jgi:hypothetical protein
MTIIARGICSGMASTKLDLLTLLPAEVHNYSLSLLNYVAILRLSVCCRLLRDTIIKDNILWRELYKQDFLSSEYRVKEWEFLFWCVRTDLNNEAIPTRRSDVIKNVDWYNTYRRRITTENNWRYGYSNITNVDIKRWGQCKDEGGLIYFESLTTHIIIRYAHRTTNG